MDPSSWSGGCYIGWRPGCMPTPTSSSSLSEDFRGGAWVGLMFIAWTWFLFHRLLLQALSQKKEGAATPTPFHTWTASGEARPRGSTEVCILLECAHRAAGIVLWRASRTLQHLASECGEHSASRPVLGSPLVVSTRALSKLSSLFWICVKGCIFACIQRACAGQWG